MTAEIAVLNKSAVALAADSAMTVGGIGKIYPTNKLFAITKYHPVGVMIYNNAEFMGVPWETIIKMYRESLGAECKLTCEEYAEDILEFISGQPIYTVGQDIANLLRIASATFDEIIEAAFAELNNLVRSRKRISERDETRALRLAVEGQIAYLREQPESESMKDLDVRRISSTLADKVNDLIDAKFEGFVLPNYLRKNLHRLLFRTIKSAEWSNTYSGIVIAGFGHQEMFPTLVELRTEGAIAGQLKWEKRHTTDIARTGTYALIKPFAQSEMVFRFMEGIDPDFFKFLQTSIFQLLKRFGEEALRANGVASKKALQTIHHAAEKQVHAYSSEAREYGESQFIDPIMEVVAHLPMDELAGLAEALVNLTSLKRRVSRGQETVGGPVDVAVISKGDGFVWIRRKHYFEAGLNPGYFMRQSLQSHPGGLQ